jgi:hypothetical protein
MEKQMEIQLNLNLEEVNGVLQALGQLPYAQVSPLVEKIRAQATPQFEAAQAAAQVQDVEPKK